jgi:hypothetical protein
VKPLRERLLTTGAPAGLALIARAAARVELRLRIGRALSVLPPALVVALAGIAGTFAVHAALPELLPAGWAVGIAEGLLVLALAGPVVAFARPLPPHAGATALDRHHGLGGRLAAALVFAGSAPGRRSPLMDLAIDDACARAGRLSPHEAAPLHAPPGLLLAAGVAVATMASARLHVTAKDAPPEAPHASAATLDAVRLDADEIAFLQEAAAGLLGSDEHPRPEILGFVHLVEELREGRIGRAGVLRRLRRIEEALDAGGLSGDPRERPLRDHLANLRDRIRQRGDAVHAARAAAFGRRARGDVAPATGEATRETEEADGDGDDPPEPRAAPAPPPDPLDADPATGKPGTPEDPRPDAPGQCAGGSEPGDGGDEPRPRAPRGGERDPQDGEQRPAASGSDAAPGTLHDPGSAGAARALAATAIDVRARGADTRRGKSRREVIRAAAERGFRSARYHDAFVEYRTVAQDRLDHDRIPDGQRFYVRRYFELIRPRR